jgi:hypothetical protein
MAGPELGPELLERVLADPAILRRMREIDAEIARRMQAGAGEATELRQGVR